jgi:hypothetical protein
VRHTVDHQRARATDAFAAVVRERDGLLAALVEPLVDDIEHLEERHLGTHIRRVVSLELPGRVRPLLTPDLQG